MTSEAAPAVDDATPAPQVDHFGIVVRDLAAALAFYRDAMGCDVTDPVVREGQGITKAYVRFGNMQVELIAPTVAESPIKHVLEDHNASDFLARNPGGGLHHVCYAVPDLLATREDLDPARLSHARHERRRHRRGRRPDLIPRSGERRWCPDRAQAGNAGDLAPA